MARKIFTPGAAHWAVVTSADPLEIRPTGSSEGVPALAMGGFTPAVDDRVPYVLLDNSRTGSGTLLVLGSSGAGLTIEGALFTASSNETCGTDLTLDLGADTDSFEKDSGGVSMLLDGWHSIHGWVRVSGLAPGERVSVEVSGADIDAVHAYGYADALGECLLDVGTLPVDVADRRPVVLLAVQETGLSATYDGWLRLVRYSASDGADSGRGPIGSRQQLDLTSRTSTGFFLDPSSAGTVIDNASAMAYDDGTGFGAEVGIRMDETGWYEATGYIDVSGTPSQLIMLRVNSPEGLGPPGVNYRPPGLTGSDDLAATSTFYVDTVPSYVQAFVTNPGGATIPFGTLTVMKWS